MRSLKKDLQTATFRPWEETHLPWGRKTRPVAGFLWRPIIAGICDFESLFYFLHQEYPRLAIGCNYPFLLQDSLFILSVILGQKYSTPAYDMYLLKELCICYQVKAAHNTIVRIITWLKLGLVSSLLVLIYVLNCTTPACLLLEQPHEGPVAGALVKLSWTVGAWAGWVWSLTLGLSSLCQTQCLVPPLEERGRNLEAVVWALLHPPCPLSDSDPLALFLRSAVAGWAVLGGQGTSFILTYLVSRVHRVISVVEHLCLRCWCHPQTAYKMPVLPKSESQNDGVTYIISF